MSNSDYNKPRINIHDELPEVFQSPVTESIYETTLNRQLSKTEIEKVFGVIGVKNEAARQDRQIKEDTVHRQAYQLQPLMYTKVATVDHVASYKDMLAQLELLGVDIDRLKKWGNADQFNFAPPINFDKLVNYTDYVWYDPSRSTPTKQYVTIESQCNVSIAKLKQKERDLAEFGTSKNIFSIDAGLNAFKLVGDDTSTFEEGVVFDVEGSTGSPSNNGLYTVVSSDFAFGQTTIIVLETIPTPTNLSGEISFATAISDLQQQVSVKCTGDIGWDIGGWDDTDDDVFWDSLGEYKATENPWVSTNHWVHRLNIPEGTFSSSNAAQGPIIEYSSFLELNEWNVLSYNWKFRSLVTAPWTVSEVEPTLAEMDAPDFLDHWVLSGTNSTKAVNNQVENPSVVTATTEALPGLETIVRVGSPADQFLLNDVTVPATIEDSLLHQAIYGSNSIRVFLDGIQQFGTYLELPDANNEFVVGVEFLETVPITSTIVIELSASATSDVGREYKYVRHIEDDTTWAAYIAGSPSSLKYTSLIRYRQLSQTKGTNEQKYPLFDLYNLDGTTANVASEIFKFAESPTEPIVPHLGIRAVLNGTDYTFEQTLIAEDNGSMFAYKDFSTIDQDNTTGLNTIWRMSDEQYIPRFVDVNRREDGEEYIDGDGNTQVASVDSSNGDWEIPNQLYFNPLHENKKRIAFSELFPHFKGALSEQTMPPEFTGDDEFAPLLLGSDEFDFGIGGTIKEFNDSYDTLLSSLYVNNNTPLSIIEFANNEYERALNIIKESFRADIYSLMLTDNEESIINQNLYIQEDIITSYELNDFANLVFGDSTTYDSTTLEGVKSWIATLPFIYMVKRQLPVSLVDTKLAISEVRHHDGHLSSVNMTEASQNSLKQAIVSTELYPGRLRGWTDNIAADGGTSTTRPLVDYSRLATGDYWLEPDNSFYRLEALISVNNPINTGSLPEGIYWIRSADGMLHIRDDMAVGGWAEVTGTPGDIDAAWITINIQDYMVDLIRELETRLYDVAPTITEDDIAFPQAQYILDTADEAVYQDCLEVEYVDYTRRIRILDPYANDYDATKPFSWNYSEVTDSDINSPTGAAVSTFWAPRWYTIYQNIFNTPYPHLEPWRLQNFTDKPSWWDATYKDETNTRRWKPIMWTNIQSGIIPVLGSPVGSPMLGSPSSVPTYSFVSVNTTGDTTTDGYGPDDLLPPLWVPPTANAEDVAVQNMSFIRVNVASLPLVNFQKDYVFGDEGPVEHQWRKSSSFLYSELQVAFKLQPVRFMHYVLGEVFRDVGGLQTSVASDKVYSHVDALFHGDLNDSDEIISYSGLLQWYVNFNRYNSYDSRNSDFRPLWKNWDTFLSYQFGGMVDSKTISLEAGAFDLLSRDRQVIVKRSPTIEDKWVDALTVTVGNFGHSKPRDGYKVPTTGGHDWEFIIDTPATTSRQVEYHPAKNLMFTVANPTTGLLETTDSLFWNTGDEVQLTSSGELPQPLTKTGNFYVVKENDTQFYLADTLADATATIPLVFTFVDVYHTGEHHIINLQSTFTALGSNSTEFGWNHHTLSEEVRSVTFPFVIRGVQQVVDFIDGYSLKLKENGFVFNHTSNNIIDEDTGRIVNWQLEIEKLIDVIYTGLGINNTPGKFAGKIYQYTHNVLTDVLTIPDLLFPFQTGQEVFVYSTGVVPTPLLQNTPFYAIKVGANTFKLATTRDNAFDGVAINIVTAGAGGQFIGAFDSVTALSSNSHEVNPFRNNLWISTPRGIVADVIDGSFPDIRSDQTIFDQHGRPFNENDIQIYRQDLLTHIVLDSNIANDMVTQSSSDTLHIGGMHVFIDGYEHVVLLNDYAVDGSLIYDAYLGLNVARLLIEYAGQGNNTLRPVVGGYVLDADKQLSRNIEGSIEDMELYYDTFIANEDADFIEKGRATIGYDEPTYLDELSATAKTKFLFWKGLIQAKGSVNAVKAFVNSAQFIDAKVDEFWAYKVADYGDNRERTYPGVKILVNDVRRDDIKYQFTDGSGSEDGWDEIPLDQQSRWVNHPDVLRNTTTNSFIFESEISSRTTYRYINAGGQIIERLNDDSTWTEVGSAADPYIILDVPADHLDIVVESGTILPAEVVRVNNNVMNITNTGDSFIIHVYTKNLAKSVHNPSVIIDYQNDTQVHSIPVWDPANGHQYFSPINVVDYQQSDSPQQTDSSWTTSRVGTVWFDESMLGYYPYYDQALYPEYDTQLFDWGKLADWADLTLWQWVSSTVPPEEYADKVAEQEGDFSIPNDEKASGVPRQVLMLNTGSPLTYTEVDILNDMHVDWYVAKTQPTLTWPSTASFKMYVNGSAFDDNTITMVDYASTHSSDLSQAYTTITGNALTSIDHVHVVREVTTAELDDGTYKYEYDFVSVESISINGVDPETTYYFWVNDRGIKTGNKSLAIRDAEAQLKVPNVPYQVFRKSADVLTAGSDFYDQLIVRQMRRVVQAEDRYMLRFTRDFALRDTTENQMDVSAPLLKNKHEEWDTFRRESTQHPPLPLWNKMVETVVGYDLATFPTTLVPVPSLDRVLYDEQYNATTRFGLRSGQGMTDKTVALNTILAVLEFPELVTNPINKFDFLDRSDFTTPEGIKAALDEIYNTFPSSAVNFILFEVLMDSLTLKTKYPDLFKTSWIAIHGIKLLETAGNANEL